MTIQYDCIIFWLIVEYWWISPGTHHTWFGHFCFFGFLPPTDYIWSPKSTRINYWIEKTKNKNGTFFIRVVCSCCCELLLLLLKVRQTLMRACVNTEKKVGLAVTQKGEENNPIRQAVIKNAIQITQMG